MLPARLSGRGLGCAEERAPFCRGESDKKGLGGDGGLEVSMVTVRSDSYLRFG